MQSIAEIKSSIHSYISSTQDLQKLFTIKKYVQELLKEEEKVIAYTAEGKPLNQKAFTSMIDESILEADRGELIDQEEIEKEL